jgi:hypothetical protein
MKNHSLTAFAVASFVALTSNAFAAEAINYNYAGVQYETQDLDGSCDQDGLNVYGSKVLNEDFFAIAKFSDMSGSKRCGSQNLLIGMGYHTLFGADSSLYGSLSLENTSVDYGRSDSGLVGAVGLRGFIQRDLEANIELSHHTAFDGNTSINGGIAYWLAPNVAATANASLGTEVISAALGLRFNY